MGFPFHRFDGVYYRVYMDGCTYVSVCVCVSGTYEPFPTFTPLGVGLVRLWGVLVETIELRRVYPGRSRGSGLCVNMCSGRVKYVFLPLEEPNKLVGFFLLTVVDNIESH